MPVPRPSYRIVGAAWIMARAFTPHRPLAMLTFPWAAMSILPGTVRGGLFLDSSRTGMVLLYRSRTLLDMLILTPVMVVVFMVYFGVVAAVLPLIATGGWYVVLYLAALLLAVAGLVFLLPRSGGSMFPFGPETPQGQRWEIAGLAQLPGTRLSGIQLALRVMDQVPPAGAVIIATANNQKLLHQYQRLGFQAGPRRRVHKTVTSAAS